MWIHFHFTLQSCLFTSGLITIKAQQTREKLRGGIIPFFGKIEKLLLASTVIFGAEALLLLILCLLVQVQRYYRFSSRMNEVGYIGELAITALL